MHIGHQMLQAKMDALTVELLSWRAATMRPGSRELDMHVDHPMLQAKNQRAHRRAAALLV